ncbi:CLUMA_CG017808, isoform A [Clunio marinus]|uniref:CLUMA_CG017808, isoform A n=1 Tax=Clunio marinus TaxID=568069 RepID=A0A1J1IYW8_9DIPT|nr:CLUMA_CG017808, isoform A [Clunio marinus]
MKQLGTNPTKKEKKNICENREQHATHTTITVIDILIRFAFPLSGETRIHVVALQTIRIDSDIEEKFKEF